jgi:hypothetical protein
MTNGNEEILMSSETGRLGDFGRQRQILILTFFCVKKFDLKKLINFEHSLRISNERGLLNNESFDTSFANYHESSCCYSHWWHINIRRVWQNKMQIIMRTVAATITGGTLISEEFGSIQRRDLVPTTERVLAYATTMSDILDFPQTEFWPQV